MSDSLVHGLAAAALAAGLTRVTAGHLPDDGAAACALVPAGVQPHPRIPEMRVVRVQALARGSTLREAMDLAEAVLAALVPVRGACGDATVIDAVHESGPYMAWDDPHDHPVLSATVKYTVFSDR